MINIFNSLLHGTIFGALANLMVVIILKVNPRYEMKSYPKEILDCVSPQTKQERLGFLRWALPMMLSIIIYLVITVISSYKGMVVSFFTVFLHIFIMCSIWNLIDLLIMDWLIFCYISPKFMALPGTEGHRGYKNYKYHFVGFLKGIVISTIASFVLGGICTLLLTTI